MVQIWIQSVLNRLTAWGLGSLARVTELSADEDMCLLLRVEVPRYRRI
jgi:hypothetical protein